jgi:hypothetical protein
MAKEIQQNNQKDAEVKYPILSQTMTDYELEFQGGLIDWLSQEFKPKGVIENMLVERIAVWCVKLFRSAKAEKEYIKATLDPRVVVEEEVLADPIQWTKKVIKKEGYTPKVGTGAIRNLHDNYLSYEVAIEDRLYKAIRELERVQSARLGGKKPPKLVMEIEK